MSKTLATFCDVKPRTRAAELLLGVLVHNAGYLFEKDRINFFSAADFSWPNEHFKLFLIASLNVMHFS